MCIIKSVFGLEFRTGSIVCGTIIMGLTSLRMIFSAYVVFHNHDLINGIYKNEHHFFELWASKAISDFILIILTIIMLTSACMSWQCSLVPWCVYMILYMVYEAVLMAYHFAAVHSLPEAPILDQLSWQGQAILATAVWLISAIFYIAGVWIVALFYKEMKFLLKQSNKKKLNIPLKMNYNGKNKMEL